MLVKSFYNRKSLENVADLTLRSHLRNPIQNVMIDLCTRYNHRSTILVLLG